MPLIDVTRPIVAAVVNRRSVAWIVAEEVHSREWGLGDPEPGRGAPA